MEIKHLLDAVLGIALGVVLYPVVDSFCAAAANNTTNIAAALILPIVPIVYLFIVIVGAASYLRHKA